MRGRMIEETPAPFSGYLPSWDAPECNCTPACERKAPTQHRFFCPWRQWFEEHHDD